MLFVWIHHRFCQNNITQSKLNLFSISSMTLTQCKKFNPLMFYIKHLSILHYIVMFVSIKIKRFHFLKWGARRNNRHRNSTCIFPCIITGFSKCFTNLANFFMWWLEDRLINSRVNAFGIFGCGVLVCECTYTSKREILFIKIQHYAFTYSFGNHLTITYSFGKLVIWQICHSEKKTRMTKEHMYNFLRGRTHRV